MTTRIACACLLLSFAGCFSSVDVNKPKASDVPELISRIQNSQLDVGERAAAIEALGMLKGEAAEAVPVGLGRVREPEVGVGDGRGG